MNNAPGNDPEPTGRYVGGRVIIERRLDLTREEAWAALTSSDRTARWIGPWTWGEPGPGSEPVFEPGSEPGSGSESGDREPRVVELRMTAEAGAPSMPIRIDECLAPERIAVSAGEGDETWTLYGEVRSAGAAEGGAAEGGEGVGGADSGAEAGRGGAVIALSQELSDPEKAAAIGPGWEFYIDRLVAAESRGDPEAIDFDDYYPAQADYYRALLG